MRIVGKINQPQKLTCNGREYVLAAPYRELPSQAGETRSEGPFYDMVPPDSRYVFMPDARFLIGGTSEPMLMHAIER